MIIKIENQKVVECFKSTDAKFAEILASTEGRDVIYDNDGVRVIVITPEQDDIYREGNLFAICSPVTYLYFDLQDFHPENYYQSAMRLARCVLVNDFRLQVSKDKNDFLHNSILTYGDTTSEATS